MKSKSLFPTPSPYNGDSGISVRDFAAIQIAAGISANPNCDLSLDQTADEAYKQADALIERSEQ